MSTRSLRQQGALSNANNSAKMSRHASKVFSLFFEPPGGGIETNFARCRKITSASARASVKIEEMHLRRSRCEIRLIVISLCRLFTGPPVCWCRAERTSGREGQYATTSAISPSISFFFLSLYLSRKWYCSWVRGNRFMRPIKQIGFTYFRDRISRPSESLTPSESGY